MASPDLSPRLSTAFSPMWLASTKSDESIAGRGPSGSSRKTRSSKIISRSIARCWRALRQEPRRRRTLRAIVSYPGSGIFAQQVGLAFLEHDALGAFVTTFAYRRDGALARALDALP